MSVLQATPVLDTCWKFAAERQRIYGGRFSWRTTSVDRRSNSTGVQVHGTPSAPVTG